MQRDEIQIERQSRGPRRQTNVSLAGEDTVRSRKVSECDPIVASDLLRRYAGLAQGTVQQSAASRTSLTIHKSDFPVQQALDIGDTLRISRGYDKPFLPPRERYDRKVIFGELLADER